MTYFIIRLQWTKGGLLLLLTYCAVQTLCE